MKHDLTEPKKEAILMFMGLLETRMIRTHNPININDVEAGMRKTSFRKLLYEVLAARTWETFDQKKNTT